MAAIFVARSAELSRWASDVGLSKHVYKLGVTEAPMKEILAAGWAGFAGWTLVKKQDCAPGIDNDGAIARLAARVKRIDPALYPRLRGETGVFKVTPAQVENHIVLTRALAGTEESGELKVKHPDFGDFLIHNALR
jgi:hypothetical protein